MFLSFFTLFTLNMFSLNLWKKTSSHTVTTRYVTKGLFSSLYKIYVSILIFSYYFLCLNIGLNDSMLFDLVFFRLIFGRNQSMMFLNRSEKITNLKLNFYDIYRKCISQYNKSVASSVVVQ